MVIEGDFFFHGIPRWNLGWATPNYAGAFLAMFLPWCWVWRSQWNSLNQWLASIASLALETVGWFLLCKTYSRGALVAAMAALLWWTCAHIGSDRRKVEVVFVGAGVRVAGVVALLLLTGFIGRITPSYTQADESVGNRLDLWRGGLEMIAASPWHGWGAGESGRAYMNWFQPVGDTEIFTTLVNSYLHVGAEYGLPVLLGVLALLLAVLLLGWRKASRGDVWVGAASASLLAWAVSNVFTTLWIEPKLWLVPGIAVVVIIWREYPSPRPSPTRGEGGRELAYWHWRTCAVLGVGAAASVSLLLYGLGTASAQRHSWKLVAEDSRTTALISRTTESSPAVWHIWPDPAVFGPTPGQELRRWAEVEAVELHVHRPDDRRLSQSAKKGGLILSGRHTARLERESLPLGIPELWLLHPASLPPKVTPPSARIVVVLPAVDETGLNAAWKAWAADANAQVRESANAGSDLRAAWPDVAPRGTGT